MQAHATTLCNIETTVRYAVVDLDNCTIAMYKTENEKFLSPQSKHFLSRKLIEFINKKNYNGFYVCTHRCYKNDAHNIAHSLNTEKIKSLHAKMKIHYKQYQSNHGDNEISLQTYIENKAPHLYDAFCSYPDLTGTDPKNQFTTRIVANLAAETKLELIKVSTPDDKNGICGSGFENILKNYEARLETYLGPEKPGFEARTDSEIKELEKKYKAVSSHVKETIGMPFPIQQPVANYDNKTKNPQLIQLAKHAAAKHPNKTIILDFVDDNVDVLSSALTINSMDLPKNVILNIHFHDAYSQSEIVLLKSIKHYLPITLFSVPSKRDQHLVEGFNTTPLIESKIIPLPIIPQNLPAANGVRFFSDDGTLEKYISFTDHARIIDSPKP
jgi:hypothetical protein